MVYLQFTYSVLCHTHSAIKHIHWDFIWDLLFSSCKVSISILFIYPVCFLRFSSFAFILNDPFYSLWHFLLAASRSLLNNSNICVMSLACIDRCILFLLIISLLLGVEYYLNVSWTSWIFSYDILMVSKICNVYILF